MKAIYHAGILFSICTLCAQPVFAAENPLQTYSVAAPSAASSMPHGTRTQAGLHASPSNPLTVVSHARPVGYTVSAASVPHRA